MASGLRRCVAREARPAAKGKRMRQSKSTARTQQPRRELLRIDGRPVSVTVRLNPRATRLIVKVHPSTGEVSVVAPSRRALDSAMDFARSESSWIARRLAHVPEPVDLEPGALIPFRGEQHVIHASMRGPAPVWIDRGARVIRVSGHSEHAPRRLHDFLKREAKRVLEARVLEFSGRIGAEPKRITVRDT